MTLVARARGSSTAGDLCDYIQARFKPRHCKCIPLPANDVASVDGNEARCCSSPGVNPGMLGCNGHPAASASRLSRKRWCELEKRRQLFVITGSAPSLSQRRGRVRGYCVKSKTFGSGPQMPQMATSDGFLRRGQTDPRERQEEEIDATSAVRRTPR